MRTNHIPYIDDSGKKKEAEVCNQRMQISVVTSKCVKDVLCGRSIDNRPDAREVSIRTIFYVAQYPRHSGD